MTKTYLLFWTRDIFVEVPSGLIGKHYFVAADNER